MNEQEIINLIRDRLAIELDDDFGPGFSQYVKVKLWLTRKKSISVLKV